MLGFFVDVIEVYDKVLSDGVDYLVVLFGSASVYSYYVKGVLCWGVLGCVVVLLKVVIKVGKCVVEIMGDGVIVMVWKLLGDIYYFVA